jgi:hypothetical protein
MGYLDWLFGTLWGMLDSPITFVTIVLAFSLGLWRKEWWIPILVALIADGATVLILYKHWRRIEIDVTTQASAGMVHTWNRPLDFKMHRSSARSS